MNVEQTLIGERDLFSETLNALESKIVQALTNLYAGVIRSTDDEIIHTELYREPRYINESTISRYNIAVKFIGKDDNVYFKKARLSVKYNDDRSAIIFEKEMFDDNKIQTHARG